MEHISRYSTWADSQLQKQIADLTSLPTELRLQILKSLTPPTTTGTQYLDSLALYTRAPECAEYFFPLYKPLYADLAARWVGGHCTTVGDSVVTLSTLAGVLPLAPWLKPYVHEVLETSPLRKVLEFPSLSTAQRHDVGRATDHDDEVLVLLLAAFRLVSYERDTFDRRFHPIFFTSLLSHESRAIRTVAVECLCLVMHFADAYCEKLLETYVGKQEPVVGRWGGELIDYRLLKLWEEKRWERMGNATQQSEDLRNRDQSFEVFRRIQEQDLHPRTAVVGDVLLPRNAAVHLQQSHLVRTPTSERNLQGLGKSLLTQKSILVAGPAGAGKTSLIMEAARLLNKHESLITLHLNEQTDAKSLIGLYTSSTKDGSFVWQAGVLTRALQQGRWVLIEDIDRAPAEVLGVLRPLIENGSLFIPNRRQHVRAAEGFRVIATVRTSGESSTSISSRHGWLASNRLWSVVIAQGYPTEEIAQLFCKRYPAIQPISDTLFAAFEKLNDLYLTDPAFKAAQGRLPAVRDLLKWCRRISRRINDLGVVLDGRSPVPENFKIDMFKDAITCLASHLSDPYLYNKVSASIAQVMNIAPQQKDFYLNPGEDICTEAPSSVKIGRSTLTRLPVRPRAGRKRPFANTGASRRGLESIAAGVSFSEPCLLVGETGVGKTTLVQHIATIVGQTLTIVNLSQQSEVSDLLGGLKPVTTRSLVFPVVEQFNSLFDDTFSASRNEKFQVAVNKAVTKESWSRLLKLWQEALQMADKALKKALKVADGGEIDGPVTKRRKLETPKYDNLRLRWSDFENNVKKLRSQVERGDKNQTFAFVEGRLVQAVRNGEWLLLDEINLASSDTLDHVVSLLSNVDGQRPSILLAEAGNVEKVVAHPNFRVFAAMNPATDAGKKDLPPALRARFTELYVHSGDDNADDLVRIVQSYLGEILNNDKRAALDMARTYLEVQQLNMQHRLTDGAGDAPHFSIRSLVRCLLYVIQHSRSHGLRRSMYEGFAMSFFTSLSRESEALCSPVIEKHLLSSVKNVKSFLAQQPKLSHADGAFVAFRHHLISKGPMNTDLQPHYIRTPSVERNLMNLARAASMRRFPILLQGPTSAGKTSMVEYLAKLSGNKFIRINNHEHTDLQEYLGSYGSDTDGKLRFREGVLVNALREGHWIVLDELNLAPSDVLEALNRLLDDNRELLIPETQEIIRPHPNFMLFATQNPAGLYGGRKRFSRAFRNRFLEIHFDDIPEDELEIILRERAQIPPSFCTQIVAVYKKLSLLRQSSRLFEQRNSFATLRDLFRWASRPVDDRQQLARHGFMLLAERVREASERELVKTTIEETMKIKLDETVLYGEGALSASVREVSGIVWTAAMRRLYVLVSEALKNSEPVLLVGETGCGKTQICQVVAAAFGRPLNIYNAHTNTETGDLIGSQRPVRSRTQLVLDVIECVRPLLESTMPSATQEAVDVEDLINKFSDLDTSALAPDVVSKAQLAIGAYRSLFVWSDGSLVRSMKLGEQFLLDEISLADDSVLERLNSVLEPGRTIVLAEKGSVDNVVVAHPDFQFVSTMNPGGDYGKRELSAALRNRMTEVWVPPLSNDDDVLPIVQATLNDNAKYLAPSMLKLTAWFKSTFHDSASSTIPLRDLLTWAKFLNTQTRLPIESAFVHGAGLVFIDSVGANPAGMTAQTISDIASARSQCLEYLQTLVSINVDDLYNARPELSAADENIAVGPFTLPRVSGAPSTVSDLVFDARTTLKNTMRIVRALQLDRPVLLEGNPGVGKTAIVTALAQAVGKSFTRINLSDQTDLMDLFGADAPSANESLGRFSWQDGPLLQAMQTGGWVLLDEMNLASQSVLEGLNSCLDHRKEAYIAELDKTFSCHPEFRLFAAQNPHHQGGGRKGLPASFVNRFTVVYADPFEEEDLMRICQMRYPEVKERQLTTIVKVVSEADHLLQHQPSFTQGGPWEVNLRDVSRWLAVCQERPVLNPMYHFDTIVAARFRDVKQTNTLAALRDKHAADTPPVSSYSRLTSRNLQVGTALLRRSSVQQHVAAHYQILPKLLPAAKSIVTAIQHGWPVIVSGPAGSGKTEILRSLAAVSGNKLVDISMNADIDTMDLLGGFEQYDPARDLEVTRAELSAALFENVARNMASGAPAELLSSLLAAWQACQATTTDAPSLLAAVVGVSQISELQPTISKLRKLSDLRPDARNQFVWNDGVLIDAIQSGSWVVLDNANLCNASVLDRLNSLLESDGHLVVSEQHSHDGTGARVIKPHPDFRIFLTVDPKYGELSRAMRNRSLEVFLSEPILLSNTSSAVRYNFTASIGGLRELESSQCDSDELAASFAENLADGDMALIQSTGHGEIVNPFNVLRPEMQAWLAQFEQLDTSAFYADAREALEDDVSAITVQQPLLRLLNEPDFAVVVQEDGMDKCRPAFEIWQLHKIVSRIRVRLETALHRSQSLPLHELSAFERSAVKEKSKKTNSASTPALYMFAVATLDRLSRFVADASPANYADAAIAKAVAYFVLDLMTLSARPSLDAARFQSFLQIGRGLQAGFSAHSHLTLSFGHSLQGFRLVQLVYGQSLQEIWPVWSAAIPKNREQLALKLALEALLERFDLAVQALPQKRTDFAPVKWRLLDAAATVWQSEDGATITKQLAESVAGLERQTADVPSSSIYFRDTFAGLFSRLQIHGSGIISVDTASLLPFVDSKQFLHAMSSTDKAFARSLELLSSLRGRFDEQGENLTADLLLKLSGLQQQPLRALQSVREEASQAVKTLSQKSCFLTQSTLEVISTHTETLLKAILSCHLALIPRSTRSHINQDSETGLDELLQLLLKHVPVGIDSTSWFRSVLERLLQPAIAGLISTGQEIQVSRMARVGRSLMAAATAALTVTVPDKPFDPALLPQIVSERHEARGAELDRQISAQQQFNNQIAGQDSSLVSRLLRQDRNNLGAAPVPVLVARPEQSTLGRVQEEFNVVIKSVLQADVLAQIFETQHNDQSRTELNRLNDIITRVVERLNQLDRAYDDIVVPVVQLLSSLGLGIELIQYSGNVTDPALKAVSHVPFLGSLPRDVNQWSLQGLKKTDHDRLQWLQHRALKSALADRREDQLDASLLTDYLTVVDSFYAQWKERLGKDQADAEVKSRYYAYRGSEDEDPEAERREMAQMFPVFDDAERDDEATGQEKSQSHKSVALQLSEIHQRVFGDTQSDPNVRHIMTGSVDRPGLGINRARLSLKDALPALLLQFEGQISSLYDRDNSKAFNIYTDPHIQEIEHLQKLVQNVRARFAQIHEQWPEHAVPIEARVVCDELLNFTLDTPLAKLLTKTEKLLEVVAQWQSVASREWSVATLLEDITGLIVSWRRLELSSWSRLLDIEKQKHDESAASWFFIAYEAVLYNSRALVDSEGDVRAYCFELVRTLEEFFRTATLGQFEPRLRLLKGLSNALSAMSLQDAKLKPVAASVVNVLVHYGRYARTIETSLSKGRAELEKAVVEQIKLASWKDTNVTALKDSARRSHHKLFKIVRKYRALLNQPISSFKSEDLKGEIAQDSPELSEPEPTQVQSAVEQCAQSVPDWHARPTRLRDPLAATVGMRRVYNARPDTLYATNELESLRWDLVESIRDLRKETPSTLTEDNTTLVKHLRERKRGLLADTIKDVAHMGIRRNLATTDLAKQATAAVVLGSMSQISNDDFGSSLVGADQAVRELIDSMPQARHALTEHSPDLTDGEVRRCVGLLEGLMLQSLSQQESLVASFGDLRGLNDTISDVGSLRASTKILHVAASGEQDETELNLRLRWLPAILDLSVQVLQIQAKHGELKLAPMEEALKAAATNVRDLQARFAELPRMPHGLTSQERADLQSQVCTALAGLEKQVLRWQGEEPNLEYLAHQLLPWVQIGDGEGLQRQLKVNGINHLALNSVDQALRAVVDSIFVALQQFSAVKIAFEDTTEDVGWLVRSDKHFTDCVRALHVPTVNEKLSSITLNLQHLRPESLNVAIALLTVASPIIEQYSLIVKHALNKQAAVHASTVRLACTLAKSFTAVANEGFCTPSDPNDGQEQSGKLESGTGLGDGEGAEDISKDVGEDEDLTEFAQGEQENQNEDMEDAEGAVDMGADDLEGQMGDAGEREEDSGGDDDDSGSDAEGDEMDEETGSVDDLDPTAVDEKMWDDAQKEGEKDEKELKGEKLKGEKTQDQTEANGEKAEGENEGEIDDAEGVDEEIEQQEDESGEGKAEAENADPHLQDEKALELPEEMQLNGEEDEKSDDEGDLDGMDELSDVEPPADGGEKDEVDNVDEPDRTEENAVGDQDGDPDEADEEAQGRGEDDEIEADQDVDKEDGDHEEQDGGMKLDEDDQGGGDKGAADQLQEDVNPDQNAEGQNQIEQQASDDKQQPQGASSADNKDQGESGKGTVERGQGRDDNNTDRQQKEALRKLADVLEQWHQRREILNPAEDKQQEAKADQDVDMNDADFEHLDEEDDESDAQALGAAGPDQTQNVDMSKAIQDEDVAIDDDTAMPDPQEAPSEEAQATDRLDRLQASANASTERREDGAFVPEQYQQQQQQQQRDIANHDADTESLISETAAEVQHLELNTAPPSPPTSHETATQLWHHCSQLTHQFSLVLTEQLRLILHPTTATKLRGDFRSGKRLNLKRIIPYIASGYKRDKIWMRRSVPSKRNYQIMLAVDDSKSMAESGADLLALQTTALLCKSLAMLEVGEVCVVGFGDGKKKSTVVGDGKATAVTVAHEFGDVWRGTESGVNVFGKLGFRQEGTDVKLLVKRALEMMAEARMKKSAAAGGGGEGELWQLMIIVSDGHCSEHDEVRRLVRRGKEERVLIVFVILDNIDVGVNDINNASDNANDNGKQGGRGRGGESILDLKEALFEEGPDGEMKVVTRRYLERFPFEYYLVVRDVRELPGVLGRCLKGWFGEVGGGG